MAKVSSIMSNGSCKWPRERNSVTQDITRHPANFIPPEDEEDGLRWTLTTSGLETATSALGDLKSVQDEVLWKIWCGYLVMILCGHLSCGCIAMGDYHREID